MRTHPLLSLVAVSLLSLGDIRLQQRSRTAQGLSPRFRAPTRCTILPRCIKRTALPAMEKTAGRVSRSLSPIPSTWLWRERDTLLQITAKGVPGTLMPPFAKSAGGMLTDQQIHDLVDGMMQQWGKPEILAGQNAPSYAATAAGDVQQGQQAFTTYCARCHGADGTGLTAKGCRAECQSWLYRRSLVSCAGERSEPAHDDDRRPARPGNAGLARRCSLACDDRQGGYGCCGVAGFASDTVSRPAVSDAPSSTAAAAVIGNTETLMNEHHSDRLTGDLSPEENKLQSEPKSGPKDHSRRVFLFKLSLLVNGAVGVVLAVPIVRYLLGPTIEKKNAYPFLDCAGERG